MSFGGSKNPPWQRNSLANGGQQGIPNMQTQMNLINPQMVGYQQNQPFNQGMGISAQQTQQNVSIISQIGGNIPTQMQSNHLFTQAVSYPAPRSLNPLSFSGNTSQQHPPPQLHHVQNQQTQVIQSQSNSNQNTSHSSTHSTLQSNLNKNVRVFSGTGTVSKMQHDFGFIDDEIYFHKNVCVKGIIPRVGDRVLVEANYNVSMLPFKWTATRIQFLAPASNVQKNYTSLLNIKTSSGYNAVPPPSLSNDTDSYNNTRRNRNSSPVQRRMSPDRHQRSREHRKDIDVLKNDEIDRKRRRDDRDIDNDRYRDKQDSNLDKREHRSPVRRSSPKRRKTRVVPRYMVQIPKVNLTMSEADILELRRRYSNLYVPSDFFFTQISWVNAFPPNAPFSIQKPCTFHIMHKDAILKENNSVLVQPNDADYLFSAKVMLMGVPPISEIYHKCFATAEDKERDDDRDFIHPTRLINFLVGIRGKNETMAIGGPWSRTLDGENPETDSSVLIRTAIRNCRALTGIDLSHCTQWYRFVELYYRRAETLHKGRVIPARIETVVIFLPDVRSCIPTLLEWDEKHTVYKKTVENVFNLKQPVSSTTEIYNSSSKILPASGSALVAGVTSNLNAGDGTGVLKTITNSNIVCSAVGEPEDDWNDKALLRDDNTEPSDIKQEQIEPTHFSDLDPKNMKVGDLRDELIARNLSPKGLRAQLIARLSKALKIESTNANSKEIQEDENIVKTQEDENIPDDAEIETDLADMIVLDEYNIEKVNLCKQEEHPVEIRIMDEKEKQLWEKRYTLPSTPHIIVHPSRTAKSGKFDCVIMSLSLLLDYRPEDTKEHSFEVSLFAELFNEMLMRDFGFNIYRALCILPEKPKEDTTKKDENNKKKDDKMKNLDDRDDKSPSENWPEDDKDKRNDKDLNKSRSKDKERSFERDRLQKTRSRRRDDDNSDDDNYSTKSNERKKKSDRLKYYTADPDLLLSFVYFDQTHCGYIFEKDIEDLFYTLGLNLSRAQTRKLVGKVITRASFNYRKLTDLPKIEGGDVVIENTADQKPTEIDLLEIAQGNNYFLPIFKYNELKTQENIISETTMNTLITPNDNNNISEIVSGSVMYKGGMINIENLVEQMKRSEKARDDIEKILVDLRKLNLELSSSNMKSQNKIKDLTSDLKSSNRKLNEAEQNFNTANKKTNEYYTIISSIHDKINPIFIKSEKSSSRTESSRETKERDREGTIDSKEFNKPDDWKREK